MFLPFNNNDNNNNHCFLVLYDFPCLALGKRLPAHDACYIFCAHGRIDKCRYFLTSQWYQGFPAVGTAGIFSRA